MNNHGPRWLLPILGLTLLALSAFGYRYHPATYFRILTSVIISPLPEPFMDAQQIPAVIDCWRHGVDVYVTDPCDPVQRPFAYSPLWLQARFIPAWSIWMGIGLESALLLSLALLPAPPRPAGPAVMMLALCSSMPVFALERCNTDVVMFILIIAGGWFWGRSMPLRLAGFPFFALAGLLKFYPLVLFVLYLRERMAIFAALCLAGCALIAAFVWHFHAELREMSRDLPVFSYFTDAFGAAQLPGGLVTALQHMAARGTLRIGYVAPRRFYAAFFLGTWILLAAAAIGTGLRLAATASIRAAIAALAPDEQAFLVIGAALICGCFFAGMNDSYRGVHFLFILPGMMALAAKPGGRVFGVSAAGILLLMWGLTLQGLVAELSGGVAYPMGGSVAIDAYWLIHELIWWSVISVLLGILFCFIAESSIWSTLKALGRGRVQAVKA